MLISAFLLCQGYGRQVAGMTNYNIKKKGSSEIVIGVNTMEVKVENEKGKKKLIITVLAAEVVPHFKETLERLGKDVKISGFRPGKAPRQIVESTVGVTRIMSEALDMAINQSYFEALVKEKINPISAPNIVIDKYPNYGQDEEVKDDLVYTAEVEVMPEIEIGDYSKLKLPEVKKQTPSKEDVDKVLEYFQKQRAKFNNVDRAAEKGDSVEIDFDGYQKGVKIDKMCSKNHPVIIGEGSLIPGFEDELIGMKKDDTKKFEITFPKDYHAKELAGQKAEFEVKMLDVKEIEKPKLDDEFAKQFGHDNMEQLNKAIEENLKQEMDTQYQNEVEGKAIETVLPLLKTEVPSGLIDKEVERMVADMEMQLKSQGLNLDLYLKSMKRDLDQLKKDFRPQAEKNVKIGLLLSKVIDDLKLDRNDPKSAKKAVDHIVETLTK